MSAETAVVRTGAEVLIDRYLHELDGKRAGLVMNPTARIDGRHMLDTLLTLDVDIVALYAPEHGFRGEAGDGELIAGGVDSATGLPVHSLYGETRKPTRAMLEDVDLLIFDMQDVGARFYTYNSTLGLILEAAAETNLPVWLLDRPNPAGGEYVSGWTMQQEHISFVGMYPVPVAHGMTLGELGQMMIGERWIRFEEAPELRVIPMEGWQRDMLWPETGLSWTAPSPNLPTFQHAYAYLGTCFIEGTSLSEGRGVEDSFLTLGSPGTNFSDEALTELQQHIPGAALSRTEFTPKTIPGRAVSPKHEGKVNRGIRLTITDYHLYDPVESGLEILTFLMRHSPDAELLAYIYQLTGSDNVSDLEELLERWRAGDRERASAGELLAGNEQSPVVTSDAGAWWYFDTEQFRERRTPYLIYE